MRRTLLFLLLTAITVSLCGCFLDPAENLYAIPEQSADFYNLQSAIRGAMPDGGAYSPPTAGENQQAVQLADLDGDQADEAIVFLKTSGDAPLSLCVFDKREEQFVLVAKIDSAGTAFDHVEYREIDGTPGSEIVLGRQISDQITQTLSVYTLHGDTLTELLSANYSEFLTTDLNADGIAEVFLLCTAAEEPNGVAELYLWADEQLQREREVRMSTPVTAVKRIITGGMCENVPAVFVASEYGEGSIVTDIFGFRGGTFTNFALSDETDTGVKTVRDYYVYSSDIDGDGLIELPRLIAMQELEGDESSKNRSMTLWYNLLLDGREEVKQLTYHDYSGGWYLEIPAQWEGRLAVSRVAVTDTTSGFRFVLTDKGVEEELFLITAVDAETETALSKSDWQRLDVLRDTVFLGKLGQRAAKYGITAETLGEMFQLIRVDWKTGETE